MVPVQVEHLPHCTCVPLYPLYPRTPVLLQSMYLVLRLAAVVAVLGAARASVLDRRTRRRGADTRDTRLERCSGYRIQ